MYEDKPEKTVSESSECDGIMDCTFKSMLRDFYNRKMLPIIIFVYLFAIIIIGAAVYCAFGFFQAENTKNQIFFATCFICCLTWVNLMKVFAWQMIHRNNIKRQIYRLEKSITELKALISNKT